MDYRQFCPVAKAAGIVGERWTLLIVRELLAGSVRFGALQAGLPGISPAVLSRRLDFLEASGLLRKRPLTGQKGYAYLPTEACLELEPILDGLGRWAMRRVRGPIRDDECDPDFLMRCLQRSLRPRKLPGRQTTILFRFEDLDTSPRRWIVVRGEDVEVHGEDPGREVDVAITTRVRTLAGLWLGDASFRQAIRDGALSIAGPRSLTRNVPAWLGRCPQADDRAPVRPARIPARSPSRAVPPS